MPTSSPSYLARLRSLDVHKLEGLPIFEQIVHKLMQGQSPLTVAKWCHEQKIDVCGLFTWKRRIESLKTRLKAQVKTVEPKDLVQVTRPAVQQLIGKRDAKKEKEFDFVDAVLLVKRVDEAMMSSLRGITAETVLKTAYSMQLSRVKQMVDLEARLGMPFAWGHLNLEALNKIGESLRRLESSETYLQSRGGNPRGEYSGDLLPHDPESQQKPLHPVARMMEQYDYIDRNLVRQASETVLQIMAARIEIAESAVRDANVLTDTSRER